MVTWGNSPQDAVALTYDMNVLQSIDAPVRFLVSLNRGNSIDERRILRQFQYDHPVYSPRAVAAWIAASRSAFSFWMRTASMARACSMREGVVTLFA